MNGVRETRRTPGSNSAAFAQTKWLSGSGPVVATDRCERCQPSQNCDSRHPRTYRTAQNLNGTGSREQNAHSIGMSSSGRGPHRKSPQGHSLHGIPQRQAP